MNQCENQSFGSVTNLYERAPEDGQSHPRRGWPVVDLDACGCDTSQPQFGTEVCIADAELPGLQALVRALDAWVEPWVCAGAEGDDPIALLHEALAMTGVSRIHLLGRGAPGRVVIGGRLLDAARLRGARLRSGVRSLREREIVVWASKAGFGAEGRRFVAALAEATGASVVASSTELGCGGDGQWRWDFDVFVRARIPFDAAFADGVPGQLSLTDEDYAAPTNP